MENHSRKPKEVVAGLLCRNGRVLICQRSASAAFPLKWEFPGGKVEKGERHEAALRRELQEELGIEAEPGEKIRQYSHSYAEGVEVNLTFFRVGKYSGRLKNLVFQQFKWVDLRDLIRFDFLDGDLLLIKELAGLGKAEALAGRRKIPNAGNKKRR